MVVVIVVVVMVLVTVLLLGGVYTVVEWLGCRWLCFISLCGDIRGGVCGVAWLSSYIW